MTREVWRGLLLALVLVGAAVAAFLTLFERTTERIEVGYSAQAQRNDYLAATRFLDRMGISTQGMPSPTPLSPLPGTEDVLLLPTKRLTVDAETQRMLLEWVHSGGHLVVAARSESLLDSPGDLMETLNEVMPESDPLLEALELDRVALDMDRDEIIDYGAFGVDFPQADDFVWVMADPDTRLVGDDERWPPLAGDGKGAVVRSGDWGAGHISIIADPKVLHNRRIGDEDHALFLWHLVNLYGTPGKVWVVSEDDMPALPGWLWQHARPLIIGLGLLALLLLVAVSRRFGPLQGVEPPRRRSLLEHLHAAGLFQWRHGDRAALLSGIRHELSRDLRIKHPTTLGLDPARAAAHLAATVGMPEADIRRALAPATETRTDGTREAFTDRVRLLTDLRKRL